MTGRKVELWPAHGWTCDECGRDNFCRGIRLDESNPHYEELMADIEEVFGPGESGEWTTRPDSVTCQHCATTFDVEDNDDA